MGLEVQIRLNNIVWAAATVIFIAFMSLLIGKAAELIARWRGVSPAEQRKIFWGFLFASPWIVGFVIFVVGPALASLYFSFTNYNLGKPMEWVGLENYQVLLTGEGAHGRRFMQAMFNSFYYALIGVPLQILTALGMALLLNQQIRGIRVFRLIFYLPVILAGGPAILLAWRYMLASNGGFINETLQGLAKTFFVFDWIYRGFIYLVEGFNGFYNGVARGDPIGAFKYTVPALIGALIFLALSRGMWSDTKRAVAGRIVEVLSLFLGVFLFARAVATNPVDVGLLYAAGALALVAIVVNVYQGKTGTARIWQFGALIFFGVGFILSLILPDVPERSTYALATGLVTGGLLATLFGVWNQRKYMLIGGAMVLLVFIFLLRLFPADFGSGRGTMLLNFATLTSSIQQPDNLEYLEDVYPSSGFSSLWLYGLVITIAGAAVILNNRYPRAQRYLLVGAFLFFTLITVGSALDGFRYFRAYESIAATTGETNFHFSLFHKAVDDFPSNERVPLWMTNELWSKPSLILITMWSSGAGMLIFLAALKGVPKVFYESAEVDGANRFQKFWKITLPMISPALFYNIVIGVIASLQTFESIYILQRPDNVDSLSSAAFYLFTRTFQQLAIGPGAAVSWILVVIIALLTFMQFRYSKWVYYEA